MFMRSSRLNCLNDSETSGSSLHARDEKPVSKRQIAKIKTPAGADRLVFSLKI
jgi:hypothetical protein